MSAISVNSGVVVDTVLKLNEDRLRALARSLAEVLVEPAVGGLHVYAPSTDVAGASKISPTFFHLLECEFVIDKFVVHVGASEISKLLHVVSCKISFQGKFINEPDG